MAGVILITAAFMVGATLSMVVAITLTTITTIMLTAAITEITIIMEFHTTVEEEIQIIPDLMLAEDRPMPRTVDVLIQDLS